MANVTEPLLDVRELVVEFRVHGRWIPVVEDVSFEVAAGRSLGLVGESGSGKTVTAMSLLGLVSALGGRVTRGSVTFEGEELLGKPERELRAVRGERIGMIFQQPTRSLNPAFTIGDQIAEVIRTHGSVGRRESWRRAVELLDRVGIPKPESRARQYPHAFSGGMCQRAMIAMALACEPRMLIADEPTTALDVTVQDRILDLLQTLQDDTGIAILFISHDLGVVSEMCDDVIVMYAGQIVERGPAEDLFARPGHPYTEGLLAALPNAYSRELGAIPGNVPAPGRAPRGCRFHVRCPYAQVGRCDDGEVELLSIADERASRCVRSGELSFTGLVAR